MLKIYNPGQEKYDTLQGCYHKNFLPFDIEYKSWIKTKNIKDADVLAIHGHDLFSVNQIYEKINQIKELNLHPDQKLLIMNIFHLDETFNDKRQFMMARRIMQQEIPNEFAIVHTNSALDAEISYDFLWNRQKIYFTDYNLIDLTDRLYTNGTDIKNFELNRIRKIPDEKTHSIRKFLCPNRIYNFDHPRIEFRKKLNSFLNKYKDYGHYANTFTGFYFSAQNPIVDNILAQGGGGTWFPIANHYYNGTYFSIFTETITSQCNEDHPYRSLTEKTWDPLIKGHFILPFGYKGMIDHIKSYGFRLPDWIDYSYDMIEDPDLRFESFINSAEKLLNYSLEDFNNFYIKDFEILEHNRKVFWDKPYDSLYDKVVEFFQIGK